jgi:hypothetical protein
LTDRGSPYPGVLFKKTSDLEKALSEAGA